MSRRTWIVVADRVDNGLPETLTFDRARVAVREGWLRVTTYNGMQMLFPADRVHVASEIPTREAV